MSETNELEAFLTDPNSGLPGPIEPRVNPYPVVYNIFREDGKLTTVVVSKSRAEEMVATCPGWTMREAPNTGDDPDYRVLESEEAARRSGAA